MRRVYKLIVKLEIILFQCYFFSSLNSDSTGITAFWYSACTLQSSGSCPR